VAYYNIHKTEKDLNRVYQRPRPLHSAPWIVLDVSDNSLSGCDHLPRHYLRD